MEKFNLNQTCPFGRLSTKHYSNAVETPDLSNAKKANQLINQLVTDFVRILDQTSKDYSPVDISEFDKFASIGHAIFDHVPGSISEVFPVPVYRNSEYIISNLEKDPSEFARVLLKLHRKEYEKTKSHLIASREVMRILRKNFELIAQEDLGNAILKLESLDLDDNTKADVHESDPSVSTGLIITPEIKEVFVQYQSMQERFENEAEINKANSILTARPEIIESILGIQEKICECLKYAVANNNLLNKSSLAFGEIAIFGTDANDLFYKNNLNLIPSSRFLKIILHNWARYFDEDPLLTPHDLLKIAIAKALKDEIYFQNICVFESENNNIVLRGVIPKVCPARTLIGRMINHYL